MDQIRDPRFGAPFKDRTYRLRRYKKAATGEQIIDWLVAQGWYAPTCIPLLEREQANGVRRRRGGALRSQIV